MASKYWIDKIESDMVERRKDDTISIIEGLLTNEPDCRTWPQVLCRRIKERCEEEFKGTWNCHVGPSFGSFRQVMASKYPINNIDSDMVERRQDDTINIIEGLLTTEPDCRAWPQVLCRRIKEKCEQEFKGTWNCHVGPSFGSSFPYEANSYFYGEWEDLSILLYKFK